MNFSQRTNAVCRYKLQAHIGRFLGAGLPANFSREQLMAFSRP